MGEITYQGDSPFRVTPARPSIARVSALGVVMTVYAGVPGKGPTYVQIQIPMSPDEARQLAAELTKSEIAARNKKR